MGIHRLLANVLEFALGYDGLSLLVNRRAGSDGCGTEVVSNPEASGCSEI